MSWLRIDDGFVANAKISQLTDVQFRVWIRLLCHCARTQDPTVDAAAIREISGLNTRRVSEYFRVGLLDEVGADFEVHNWAKYLPREAQNAARQAKWRARHRNAESNGDGNARNGSGPSRASAGTRARSRTRTRTDESKGRSLHVAGESAERPEEDLAYLDSIAQPDEANGLGFQIPADLVKEMPR